MANQTPINKSEYDELKEIINNSFDSVQKNFEKMQVTIDHNHEYVQRRLDVVVTDVAHIKKGLKRVPTQKEVNRLKGRVHKLEQAVFTNA